ncbi:MAG: DUF2232 domain-containing protein [Gammaproteobacteria bacterium]|nr:DUF2232 domain-containing protein [Gammaproteobacteria bacterium]
MIGIARFALKSPFHAFTIVGLLAVLSLIIPFVSLLSGAIVSLIILTQGLHSGLKIIVLSIIATSAMTWLSMGSPIHGLMVGIVQWLPMVILAELLRRTQSMSYVILVSIAMGVVAVLLQFALWPDLELFWRNLIEEIFSQSQQSAQYEELKPAIDQIVHWALVVFIAAMVATYVSTLMFGRWFQAKLVESDGYQKEFYEIKLGRTSAIVSIVIIAASLFYPEDWLVASAIVVAAGFLFQGLAVIHVRVSRTNKKGFFIGLFYFLMFVFPQVVGFTTVVGIIDNWFNYRSRGDNTPKHID